MNKFDSFVKHILEATKEKPSKKLDYTADDVNSDGKVDKTDGYLKKRSAAIAGAIAKKSGKKEEK